MRVVLYCRSSTKAQQVTDQEYRLRRWADNNGHTVVGAFTDQGVSGATRKREGLNSVLQSVCAGGVDAVVVTRFSRLYRNAKQLLQFVDTAVLYNTRLISIEECLDTTTPHGRLLMTTVAAVNEFELGMLHSNIVNGLIAAKRNGTRLGRPPISDEVKAQVAALLNAGTTIVETARRVGIHRDTVRRIKNGETA